MGRCNPADCNHHVSFRRWHFPCKRTRLSEARRRAGIPGRNSRLVLALFPGSGALLSCNHHSNAGSAWLLNIAQEGSVEVDAESFRAYSFRNCAILARHEKLQHRNLYALTRRESSATRVASISSMWRNLGEQVSKLAAPNTALCAASFLNAPD
jgi:hypothetical protein